MIKAVLTTDIICNMTQHHATLSSLPIDWQCTEIYRSQNNVCHPISQSRTPLGPALNYAEHSPNFHWSRLQNLYQPFAQPSTALLSPVNSLFHVRGQTTETAVLPFTGQSCGTVFQPISICWTFHCQCSGNDWKCSCSRIGLTVIVQRLTWRICCVAKFAHYKCH